VANTPGFPEVGTCSTFWKPASRSAWMKKGTPVSKPFPSAAMHGSRIHACRRWTFSSCRRAISAPSGPEGAAASDSLGNEAAAAVPTAAPST
jgi:hypothetical protein